METSPATAEDWELIAKETLIQYYNRGGTGNGDSLQLLEGSDLVNVIGYSLSLVPNVDLSKWTADHFRLARNGNLSYYADKNLEAIEHITKKLEIECKGAREIFICVLPVSFFYLDSLFTLPVFRFRPSLDHKNEKFMDHTGRVYDSFDDWKSNNTLPAVKILYPQNGHLKLKENDEGKPDCVLEDAAECSRPVKTLLACDIASGALGILAGVGATMATGGVALLAMGGVALSASYGAGRTGFLIHDRVKHSETVNPFKSREAFYLWLGFTADIVTFGTIGAASAKILSTISQSTKWVDISRKFASAARAMSIFSSSARPVTDSAKALLTGYEIFTKVRHKSADTYLKLPKTSLMQLTNSMDEFSEDMLLMMSVSEGFWSKSKMKYCSPEEFKDMLISAIIVNMADQCVDAGIFEDVRLLVQHDSALVETYKHVDDVTMDLDMMVQVIHDVFESNDDRMEIKLAAETCEIKLADFFLSIKAIAKMTSDERFKIVKFLHKLSLDQRSQFLTIQDYVGNNADFLKMLAADNATELVEVWYDVFVICFDEHLSTIPSGNVVSIRNHEVPIDILLSMKKEERLNLIFALKCFTDEQSDNFRRLISLVEDSEKYFRILAIDNKTKEDLINALRTSNQNISF